MVGERRAQAIGAATITDQFDISLIADTASRTATAPTARPMLARLNIVNGIFSRQVGVLILVTDVLLIPAASDPFTATDSSVLLSQLRITSTRPRAGHRRPTHRVADNPRAQPHRCVRGQCGGDHCVAAVRHRHHRHEVAVRLVHRHHDARVRARPSNPAASRLSTCRSTRTPPARSRATSP
jgi:hypothetical protein